MWNQIFVVQVSVLEKIVATVLVYTPIALLFRLTQRGLANLKRLTSSSSFCGPMSFRTH